MRWDVALFDDAGDVLHSRIGLSPDYHRQHGAGTFDLEHHPYFLREVLPDVHVSVYACLVDTSRKCFHYLMFMVNETKGTLTAISSASARLPT